MPVVIMSHEDGQNSFDYQDEQSMRMALVTRQQYSLGIGFRLFAAKKNVLAAPLR
jgi:hypothetical protein